LTNPDEAVLDTPEFGSATSTPPDGLDAVIGALPPLKANVPLAATVTDVRGGPGPIPAGGAVVSTIGKNAAQLRDFGVAPGDRFTIHLDIDDPAFASAACAGGGGPWIVRSGRGLPRGEMEGEAFSAHHVDELVART